MHYNNGSRCCIKLALMVDTAIIIILFDVMVLLLWKRNVTSVHNFSKVSNTGIKQF